LQDLHLRRSGAKAVKVVIEAGTFADQLAQATVNTLLQFGLSGQHRISLEDPDSDHYRHWHAGLPKVLQDAWDLVLSDATNAEAREASRVEIRIAAISECDWSGNPPRLPLSVAFRLLCQPFRFLLENGRNDRSFLLAVASPDQRRVLHDMEGHGFLEFVGAGGIGELCQILEESVARHPRHRAKLMIITDSDALHPGDRSPEAQRVAADCEKAMVAVHILRRRAIENYLPMNSLRKWMQERPGIRRALFEAYCHLTPEQRHHFNMKRGFAGDLAVRGRSCGTLYSEVPPGERDLLQCGFGSSIADLFKGPLVTDDDLDRDGGRVELAPILSLLIALAR
jgi:hypothetical protein